MIDAIDDNFDLVLEKPTDSEDEKRAVLDIQGLGKGVTCYSKTKGQEAWDEKKGQVMSIKKGKGPALVSFIPPTGQLQILHHNLELKLILLAGMFIFLAIHIAHHPSYPHMLKRSSPAEATRTLMDQLWRQLAESHVLVAPGWGFDANGVHNIGGDGVGYFRLSFSTLSYAQCRTGMKVFSEQLDKFFEIK